MQRNFKMKQTYSFLKKSIFIILAEIVFAALLGAVSFTYLYDSATDSLAFPNIITILFMLVLIGSVATIIAVCLKAKKVGISHIKKTNKFILFADAFGVIMMLIFFIYECITSMTYMNADSKALLFFRSTRWIMSIPALGYFIIQALPKKIKRTKIVVPPYLKIIASVSVIAWCVLGIFTTYFAKHLTNPADVTKISMMFIYAILAMFFIFEGEFENVKTRHKPYMILSFISALAAFSFPFGMSVAKIFRADMTWDSLSQPELLACAAIGLYALAKMFALVSTMGIVIENEHGKKHHHSSSSSKASTDKATANDTENAKNTEVSGSKEA